MNLPAHVDLVRLLLDGNAPPGTVGEVPAARFTSAERFAEERAQLFARVPAVVALSRDLARGACTVVDVAGVSTILARGDDGVVRGFKNACRHRGTELIAASSPGACTIRKALVCPYHAWTYDLTGRRIHVPHAASFACAPVDVAEGAAHVDGNAADPLALRASLVDVPVAEQHGLVFAALAPFDVDAHITTIAADLAALGAAEGTVFRTSTREVRANWKLIVDAFLDGYHIRFLHKASIGRFFLDATFVAERAGDHVRACTARTALKETASLDGIDVRAIATPSYLVFPSAVLIFHPDYVSVMRLEPVAHDHTRFHHAMIVPRAPRDDEERAHFDRSFSLIDDGVFAREDLMVVEAIQRGLATGANDTVLYGALEHPSLWFHARVDELVTSRG